MISFSISVCPIVCSYKNYECNPMVVDHKLRVVRRDLRGTMTSHNHGNKIIVVDINGTRIYIYIYIAKARLRT